MEREGEEGEGEEGCREGEEGEQVAKSMLGISLAIAK